MVEMFTQCKRKHQWTQRTKEHRHKSQKKVAAGKPAASIIVLNMYYLLQNLGDKQEQ